ncbi:hypothetical protein BT93_F0405 [Corymbia citriodora subsp. variegata]|nr:hypothetical protein BT93_F0405 [Corymbia citriodora subsp. variegata]
MVYFGFQFKSLSSMMLCSHLQLQTSLDKTKLLRSCLLSHLGHSFCFFWQYFWYKWFVLGASSILSLQ